MAFIVIYLCINLFILLCSVFTHVVDIRILQPYSLHFIKGDWVKGMERGAGKPVLCVSFHSRKRSTQEWYGRALLNKPFVYTFWLYPYWDKSLVYVYMYVCFVHTLKALEVNSDMLYNLLSLIIIFRVCH